MQNSMLLGSVKKQHPPRNGSPGSSAEVATIEGPSEGVVLMGLGQC